MILVSAPLVTQTESPRQGMSVRAEFNCVISTYFDIKRRIIVFLSASESDYWLQQEGTHFSRYCD